MVRHMQAQPIHNPALLKKQQSLMTKISSAATAGWQVWAKTNTICHLHGCALAGWYGVFHHIRLVSGSHPPRQYLLCWAEYVTWPLNADGTKHFLIWMRMSFNPCTLKWPCTIFRHDWKSVRYKFHGCPYSWGKRNSFLSLVIASPTRHPHRALFADALQPNLDTSTHP